ncbi:hypothetical protein ACIPL1_23345 [Pseudomonas sp. NPDC090202]|uniref:hypothetical protein n=1 Tax=unclassified Pseudomonas TaxID=196821 RepID=UPI00380B9456
MIDSTTEKNTRGLAAPIIPQADATDGLLTLEALQLPVTLNFPLWDDSMPTDYNQLLVNGLPTGDIKKVADDQPGDIVSLEIPPVLLMSDSVYAIGYRASVLDGLSADSPSIPMIVDRSAPGGRLIAPLIFDNDLQMLKSDALKANGNSLTARLPGYFDAKWGDVVRTYWGEQAGPEYTLTTEDPGSDHIEFTFGSQFIDLLADGEASVTYTITDRAGNLSMVSQPVVLRYPPCKEQESVHVPIKLCISLCQSNCCTSPN